jgi:hypothetical protein
LKTGHLNQLPVVARLSRAILSGLARCSRHGCRYREKIRRGYTLKSREAHVFARIHLKIEDEGIGYVWFNDLGIKFYEDRVLAK